MTSFTQEHWLRKTVTNIALFIARLSGVQTNVSLLCQNSISICEFSEEWELFDDVSTSINMNNADFGSYDIRWQDTA